MDSLSITGESTIPSPIVEERIQFEKQKNHLAPKLSKISQSNILQRRKMSSEAVTLESLTNDADSHFQQNFILFGIPAIAAFLYSATKLKQKLF